MLLVPALAIGLPAVFMPVYLQSQGATLPADNVAMIRAIAFAAVAAMVAAAGFLVARRIEVRGDQLIYHSWLKSRQWPLTAITDVTYEDDIIPEVFDGAPFHWLTYLRLWRGTECVLELNYLYWRRGDMARLVDALLQRQPALQIGPRARVYLNRRA